MNNTLTAIGIHHAMRRNRAFAIGEKTLFIVPGSPWENGYVESFNGNLRDELLNGEIFYSLREARVLNERWREVQPGPAALEPETPTPGPRGDRCRLALRSGRPCSEGASFLGTS